MDTYSNPFKQFPGNPRLSIPYRQPRKKTITLTEAQYKMLAEEIAERISSNRDVDEILFSNHIWTFEAEVTKHYRTVFTGVEFLGSRESYSETEYILKSLKLSCVTTLSGIVRETDIDTGKLSDIIEKISMTS